jgi:hypothetical protein
MLSAVSPELVVPYDGTSNDDALALAKLLAQTQIHGRFDVVASPGGHVPRRPRLLTCHLALRWVRLACGCRNRSERDGQIMDIAIAAFCAHSGARARSHELGSIFVTAQVGSRGEPVLRLMVGAAT